MALKLSTNLCASNSETDFSTEIYRTLELLMNRGLAVA